ncbi:MAG: hypothetical protein IJR26_11160 [Bacteroidales bacterium]|nr:hypothetical protein [Bacteroidales bacterium]
MINNVNDELIEKIQELIDMEGRSCSMDIAGITPEYVWRMWGGRVPIEEIESALKAMKHRRAVLDYKIKSK